MMWRYWSIVEILPPSDVILDVLHSLGKSTEFICGKLLSPDGAVMASLRRLPINGGVQFSPLSVLHLIDSVIPKENTQNSSSKPSSFISCNVTQNFEQIVSYK